MGSGAPPRYRVVEMIIGASVVVISIASLFLVVQQNRVMERQLEASVRPYVQIDTGNIDEETGETVLYVQLANPGLGPARVESFQGFLDGAPVGVPGELAAACCVDGDTEESRRAALVAALQVEDAGFVTATVEDYMLEAGRVHDVFRFKRPAEDSPALDLWRRLDRVRFGGFDVEVCYCSMFDACWTTRLHDRQPKAVKACASPAG